MEGGGERERGREREAGVGRLGGRGQIDEEGIFRTAREDGCGEGGAAGRNKGTWEVLFL